MTRRELFDAAAARHGVVVADDVSAAELAASTFRDWRRRERLRRPHHDVTVLPGAVDTPHQRIAVAVAGIGTRCAVTGWAAAFLHGLRRAPPTVVDVLAPHGASHRPHDRVRVVETTVFDDEPLDVLDGIPVVRPARWVADLARAVDLDTLVAVALDLRQRGRLATGDLDAQLVRRRRFPGRARLRALADLLREDDSDSGFELHTRGRLQDRGTPPDPRQLEVVVGGHVRRIDLPYASRGVGVECVGLAHHGRDAFDGDAERRNDFAEDGGWRLLELTWTTFLLRWDDFCARLDRLLLTGRPT